MVRTFVLVELILRILDLSLLVLRAISIAMADTKQLFSCIH